jgi:hypothetical protein
VFIDEKNEARILPVIAPALYAFAAVLFEILDVIFEPGSGRQ